MSARTAWIAAGNIADIPPLGAQRLKLQAITIGLFRGEDDQVFAIEDACPHKNGPLTQGIVHGACVTCPLHNWVISLSTGQAQGADEGSVSTFPVKVDGDGAITLEVPLSAFEKAAA